MGEGYGASIPVRADRVASVWTINGTFVPVDGDVNEPCAMDYWVDREILFCLDTGEPGGNERLCALNGNTGALIQALSTGVDLMPYGYGTIDLDPATDADIGQGAFIVRETGGYCAGKFSFEWITPLAAENWALYE